MAKLTVEIVTAERQVYNETDVDMVVAPGSEGVLGILHLSLCCQDSALSVPECLQEVRPDLGGTGLCLDSLDLLSENISPRIGRVERSLRRVQSFACTND